MTLLEKIRRNKGPTTATDGEETGGPGRDQPAEATLHASHRTPNTVTILGFSLLAAALLFWYYTRAYAHVHKSPPTFATPNATPAPDTPLPPLPRIEPPSLANLSSSLDSHPYVIGDILDPNNDLAADNATAEGTSGEGESDLGVVTTPSTPSAQHSQTRRLDGAVFTHATGQANPTISTPINAPGNSVEGSNLIGPDPNTAPATESSQSALTALLRTETTPTIAAAVLPTQRLLLPKGAFLDCTLETAIDSTLPSLTTCLTAFDTFSADGTVVLLERGTKLIGEMRSQVQQGSNRVFVLWTEARTPKGIVVPLASPGTDALGRSGIPGAVDRHFIDRFGAAILVSMIDGVIQGAANRSQKSGGTVVLNPSGAGDITTEVLRSTINIPPTVRVPPGARIQVLVARDLDFRSVYSLHVR